MPESETTPLDTVDPARLRRVRIRKALATVGVLAALVAGGLLLARTRDNWKSADVALVVDPQYLDFGEVWAQPDFQWTLPIRNTSRRDIRIDGFRVSCKCSSIEPESLVIPAHGEATISLSIDLTGTVRSAPLGELRRAELQIVPSVEAPNGPPPAWILGGSVAGQSHQIGYDQENSVPDQIAPFGLT